MRVFAHAIEADARAELIEAHKTGDMAKSILVYHGDGTIERFPLADPSDQKKAFEHAWSIRVCHGTGAGFSSGAGCR